ncbi:MAG: hypothetical protein ACR2RF_22555 [Geminicoccaceae bacterium]
MAYAMRVLSENEIDEVAGGNPFLLFMLTMNVAHAPTGNEVRSGGGGADVDADTDADADTDTDSDTDVPTGDNGDTGDQK